VTGGRGPRQRVRTARNRSASSTRWLERQLNDPYVRRAKAENYRSRAAYKLLELDERFGLLKGVTAVIDLGIAPGGWSQVLRRRVPKASIVGIDLLPTDPIEGVEILQMDFMDEAAPDRLKTALGGPADLVLSDMAANTVGHPQTDHLRTMALVEAGLEFATEVLKPGGAYVAKVLAGGADNQLVAELKRHFTTVKHAKPPASRKTENDKLRRKPVTCSFASDVPSDISISGIMTLPSVPMVLFWITFFVTISASVAAVVWMPDPPTAFWIVNPLTLTWSTPSTVTPPSITAYFEASLAGFADGAMHCAVVSRSDVPLIVMGLVTVTEL